MLAGLDLAQGTAPLSATPAPAAAPPKLSVRDLDFWYGDKQALKSVTLDIPEGEVTAFIGPSGCGKSTLLKCLNRMQDDVRGMRIDGEVLIRDGDRLADVYAEDVDPPLMRRRFGWVAQKPNPFPWTVAENLEYGALIHGLIASREERRGHVERLLRATFLWDELKDRLREPGTNLSGGQQQRLCIARALSIGPEILLMDEPCGSLDPVSTERVEELILELRGKVTIVLITHNMEQARRVADHVAFFKLGEMLEYGGVDEVFGRPRHHELKAYLDGLYG